jgi:hypothetical protein
LEIAREQVLEFVRSRAGDDGLARAEQELPARIDTERDAELLDGLGVDPLEVVSQFNGGLLPS